MRGNIQKDIAKLSVDIIDNNMPAGYSVKDGSEAIRRTIEDMVGGEWNYHAFMQNKHEIFQIVTEALDVTVTPLVLDAFSGLADVHDVSLGDQIQFRIADTELFEVATIASGTQDLNRQRIFNEYLTVPTDWAGVKIYAEFEDFMMGKVDWNEMINRVADSFVAYTGMRVYEAIQDSYDELGANRKYEASYDPDNFADFINEIELLTGTEVAIYGTKAALGKIKPEDVMLSDTMKDDYNTMGYFGKFRGTDMIQLPQGRRPHSNDPFISNDVLYILPAGEKIAKIVYEGDSLVIDGELTDRNDLQPEFSFIRKMGVAAIQATNYGIAKIA